MPRTRKSLRESIAEATGGTPLPEGTGRFLAGAAGLILAIGLFVWWIVRASDDERGTVQEYVAALRRGDDVSAYALLTSAARGEQPLAAWRAGADTALLRSSQQMRVDAVRPITDANKGCVRAVVSGLADTSVTFYLRDESGPRIHAIRAARGLEGARLLTNEPWQCF